MLDLFWTSYFGRQLKVAVQRTNGESRRENHAFRVPSNLLCLLQTCCYQVILSTVLPETSQSSLSTPSVAHLLKARNVRQSWKPWQKKNKCAKSQKELESKSNTLYLYRVLERLDCVLGKCLRCILRILHLKGFRWTSDERVWEVMLSVHLLLNFLRHLAPCAIGVLVFHGISYTAPLDFNSNVCILVQLKCVTPNAQAIRYIHIHTVYYTTWRRSQWQNIQYN